MECLRILIVVSRLLLSVPYTVSELWRHQWRHNERCGLHPGREPRSVAASFVLVLFVFVVLGSVFQYYATRLARKNVSEMIYFVSSGTQNLNSIYTGDASTLGLSLGWRLYCWWCALLEHVIVSSSKQVRKQVLITDITATKSGNVTWCRMTFVVDRTEEMRCQFERVQSRRAGGKLPAKESKIPLSGWRLHSW